MNLPRRKLSEARTWRRELDDLERQDAELARTCQLLSSRDGQGWGELFALMTSRSMIANRRIALLTQWMNCVTTSVMELERGSHRAESQSERQEKLLQLLCEAWNELDDPYGFGVSLDERIAGDDENLAPSGR
jgi:hypothetical protein